jgi:hypothetical protein
MKKICCIIIVIFLTSHLLFGQKEKLPDPFIELTVGTKTYKNSETITLRTSEKVDIKAKMQGGKRWWSMFPNKYANLGKTIVIESFGENGITYSSGTGLRSIWSLKSEKASWWGQLNDGIKSDPNGNTAVLTAPSKTGKYILTVKLITTWHLVRSTAAGGNKEEDVEEKSEATFSVIVEQGAGVWFSSANITASGDEDNDIRFRLQNLQNKYDIISDQLLKNQYNLAQSGLSGIKEELAIIKKRLDQLKKEKKSFQSEITLIGLPSDKAMKRLKTLKEMNEKWKNTSSMCGGNALQINQMLLNKQTSFTSNVLKSVFKNYLDWGAQLPNVNNLFGAVPYQLSALIMPSDLMDWWGQANEDASILKDQIKTIAKLNKLRDFYLKRQKESLDEAKNIKKEIEKNQQVEKIDIQAKAIVQSSGCTKFKPEK